MKSATIRVLGCLLLYAVAAALVATLWPRPWTLTICYVLFGGILLYFWHSKRDLWFYGLAFVLGPSIESVAILAGAWKYTDTVLVPTWLPFAWGIAVLLAHRLVEDLAGPARNEPR